MSDLVESPNCWFSHAKAHLSVWLYLAIVSQHDTQKQKVSNIKINVANKCKNFISLQDLKGISVSKRQVQMTIEQQNKHFSLCVKYLAYNKSPIIKRLFLPMGKQRRRSDVQ